jgi:hypothetical protein
MQRLQRGHSSTQDYRQARKELWSAGTILVCAFLITILLIVGATALRERQLRPVHVTPQECEVFLGGDA